MSSEIREFVMAQPLFDSHEHLLSLPRFAATIWAQDLPCGLPAGSCLKTEQAFTVWRLDISGGI